jgi:hypothetical protein
MAQERSAKRARKEHKVFGPSNKTSIGPQIEKLSTPVIEEITTMLEHVDLANWSSATL